MRELTGCRVAPHRAAPALRLALLLLALAAPAEAVDTPFVLNATKISKTTLPGIVGGSRFGLDVANLGDVNGDGNDDLAVGARTDGSTGTNGGAVWILYLDANGSVINSRRWSEQSDPNNAFQIEANTFFGDGLAGLGDYDNDGRVEVAVGASFADPGAVPTDSGAVWVIDLDPATLAPMSSFLIASNSLIAGGSANFATLDADDRFGLRVTDLGDWDGDGAPEIAVGAIKDDDGATDNGAFYILYLAPDGSGVKTWRKISATTGGFDGVLDGNTSFFGMDVAAIGDLDGLGQTDLAVGAPLEGPEGAVFLLKMDPACGNAGATPPVPFTTCVAKPGSLRIAEGSGGFPEAIANAADFGTALAWLDGAGSAIPPRLAVGAMRANSNRGEVWVLSLGPTGHVTGADRIASALNWNVTLDPDDNFGIALDEIGDLDGNGVIDLAVGSWQDDDNTTDSGALYLLRLSPCTTVVTHPIVFASPNDAGENPCLPISLPSSPQHTLHLFLETGTDLSTIPANRCKDGLGDGDELCAWDVRFTAEPPLSIVGFSPTPAGGGGATGPPAGMETQVVSAAEFRANWIGPLSPSNPAAGPVKIGDLYLTASGPGGNVKLSANSAAVGSALELLPMAGRTIALPEPDQHLGLAAGLALLALLARRRAARARRTGGIASVLALALIGSSDPAAADISVKGQLGFVQPSGTPTAFWGISLAPLGDLDGDGTQDLMVGDHDTGSPGNGRFWVLFLDEDEGVLGHTVVNGGVAYSTSVSPLGDIDGDGGPDFIHGRNPAVSTTIHRVELLSLKPDGTRKSENLLVDDTSTHAGLELFGRSVAALGDIDGNGTIEFAVGEPGLNNSSSAWGAVRIYSLDPVTRSVVGSLSTIHWNQLPLSETDYFGTSVVSLGDLDGDNITDIAVGASLDDDAKAACSHGSTPQVGSVYVIFLQHNGSGAFSVKSYQKISETQGGLDLCLPGVSNGHPGTKTGFGYSLAWRAHPDGGGVLYVGARNNALLGENASIWPIFLNPNGTVRSAYRLSHNANVGFINPKLGAASEFGNAILALPDMNGDEIPDLAVADFETGPETFYLLYLQDSDYDGLDDNLDNCDFEHNPLQEDQDADGVGDLCDNCVDLANSDQADADNPDDGEGDVCEPVEIRLETTGTPAAPSWSLSLQCGAYSVTDVAGAIVLPSGATNPKTLTLSGGSIGSSSTSGPGLGAPPGVRGDAIYFSAAGNGSPDNRLCSALQAPVSLGTLTTGPIGGTQLAAAALTAEGVGTPGFGLALAERASGPVPQADIRFVNGLPLPLLDVELGPAVQTASGTRWEVRAVRSSDEFHRVAFGLAAPAGTTAGQMRWVGCDTAPSGGVRACCESPPCGDFDGLGLGTYVNPNQSWTVGPQASPPGTQLADTMYVVLEGSGPSLGSLDAVNPSLAGEYHVLGEVELSSTPDLQPALTHDGANDIDDLYGPGKVAPLVTVASATPAVEQMKLIAVYNPPDDFDGDGKQNLGDNCAFKYNPAQTNLGSFRDDTPASNPLGDACECAEATGDGAVMDPEDFEQIRDLLGGKITNPVIAAQVEERCSIVGSTECNIRDLVFLGIALEATPPASVETRCDAALSPADPNP